MPETAGFISALDDDLTRRLVPVLRAVFPHDDLSDAPYRRSAEAIIADARGSIRQAGVIVEGVRSLEALTGGDLTATDGQLLTDALRQMTQTAFFQTLLTSAVVTLYSDPETWEFLGYEGFSTEKGGYVHRGFDDIDWLPSPRITEYEGDDPLVDYVPAIPGRADFDTSMKAEMK